MRLLTKVKWLLLILVIGLLLYWLHPRVLEGLGRFLIKEDQPQRADLIVCLSGAWPSRTIAAADLYQGGWGRKVFIFRELQPEGFDLLARRGIHLPETRDLTREVLLRSGVPKGSILSDDREATSTYDEACIVRDFLRDQHHCKMILVTSKYHSRRAYLTFRSLLDPHRIEIRSIPSSHDEFNPQKWWRKEIYREYVFLEYQKYLASLLRGRINALLLIKGA